jgi:hypothetical protein
MDTHRVRYSSVTITKTCQEEIPIVSSIRPVASLAGMIVIAVVVALCGPAQAGAVSPVDADRDTSRDFYRANPFEHGG